MTSLSSLTRACALVALALYTSCNDGDGAPGPVTVHYSMTNYDGCVEEEASLELAAAHSVVARTDTGVPDCTLDERLASRGCTMIVGDVNAGERLTILVRCGVGDHTPLFSCKFTTIDLAALNDDANISCGCLAQQDACYTHGVCDLCASETTERTGCEECDEGLDEDGDGEIDCDDTDCELTQECGFGRTTITCSDSTSTSTTSSTLEFVLEAVEPEAAPMTHLFGARD
jgi:hypothetical protein